MRACIIYLVKADDDYVRDFKASLESLYKNFLNQYNYPVIAFVEKEFSRYAQQFINYKNLHFEYINFSIPKENANLDIPKFFPHPTHGNGPIAWGHPGFSMGYRHMCRFFSGDMYNHPIFDKYDYYMRLDTDSIITKQISYDLFEYCASKKINYGFYKFDMDNPKTVVDLWETSSKYFGTAVPNPTRMFYTNFEIGNINWFRTSGYMDYFNHLDKEGGFFTKRWGDAPVKYIGVTMLCNPQYIKRFDIGYHHGTVKQDDAKLRYNVP